MVRGMVLGAAMWLNGCCCGGGGRPRGESKATGKGVNIYVAPGSRTAVGKIAILPFKAPTELIGHSVSDMVVTEMLKGGYYELVERGQMAKVLGESELQMSGMTDAKAVEMGAMLGAEGVMIGSVDEYSTLALKGKAFPVVGVSVRMINCRNGKILWSADMGSRAKDAGVSLPEHARKVVREITAAVAYELKRCR
jgi:TolB-like protein